VIVSLLIKDGGLVKTQKFGDPKYVGDPINAVRTFNEKEVDEIFIADIDATRFNREPNFDLISRLASECRMPLCYAGGISRLDQCDRIIGLGVEKVALGSAAISSPQLVSDAAKILGSQSVVVVVDVKRFGPFGKYEVVTENGTKRSRIDPVSYSKRAQELGAGEIVLQSVDRDGMMLGYDVSMVDSVFEVLDIPMTVLGGAGKLSDIERLVSQFEFVGAAAGSLFVFKGKYRAVLITYPPRAEKDALVKASGTA
jgi:cyclase